MKSIFLSLLAMLILGSAFAQDIIKDRNVEDRKLSGFHGVEASAGIHVYISQGESTGVAVSANSVEARDRITTKIVDGILKISYDFQLGRALKGDKELKAYVSVKELSFLGAHAGSIITPRTTLKVQDFKMVATSGSIIKGNFDGSGNFEVEQNSGSIITIGGNAAVLLVKGSSGSIFNGYGLVAGNCNAVTTSGAMIEVNVEKELSVKASSGGSIKYKGDGVIKNVHTNSGGSLSKKR